LIVIPGEEFICDGEVCYDAVSSKIKNICFRREIVISEYLQTISKYIRTSYVDLCVVALGPPITTTTVVCTRVSDVDGDASRRGVVHDLEAGRHVGVVDTRVVEVDSEDSLEVAVAIVILRQGLICDVGRYGRVADAGTQINRERERPASRGVKAACAEAVERINAALKVRT
jgi:hypothetical protein